MKKPFDFKDVNFLVRCKDCKIPLKKNLLHKKPNAKRCYTCHTLNGNNQNINRDRLREVQLRNIISYSS